MKRKIMKITALLTAMCLLLAGCGGAGSTSSTASSAAETESALQSEEETGEQSGDQTEEEAGQSAGELQKFSVVLDWYPNAVHAFLYDAIEKGYFAEEGLDVEIVFPSNDNDAITLVAAGKVDVGMYYMDDAIMTSANQDVPIRCIGTVVNTSLDIIASLAEKGISRPKDLDGKIIGFTDTLFGEAVIRCMLENDGVDPANVQLINVGFDLMSSMTTGNVDATYGCFINHEIPQLEKEGFPMNTFRLSDYGVPDYYALSFLAGADALEKDPERFAKFLRGCQKGFADMRDDSENCLATLLDNQDSANFPLDPEIEKKSLDILLPMMESEGKPFLYQDPAVFEENIAWLKEYGLLKNDIAAEDIIVNPMEP